MDSVIRWLPDRILVMRPDFEVCVYVYDDEDCAELTPEEIREGFESVCGIVPIPQPKAKS